MILIKYTRYNNKDMVSFCEAGSMQEAEDLIAKLLQLKHVTEAKVVEDENCVDHVYTDIEKYYDKRKLK